MAKYFLLFYLYCSMAIACDAPLADILQGIQAGWPNLEFHYQDDEAKLVTIQFFSEAEVDNIYAFSSPGRAPIFIASLAGCVVGRAVLPPEALEKITQVAQQYRHYKKLEKWRTNP